VCLHEEDFGILWKHTDLFTGEVDVRRARRLVVSSISTVGNYEYGLFWYFHQDGSIHFEMKATGILNTAGLRRGEAPTYGTIVSPGVYAHYHQHVFNVRLDMAVDGERNRVVDALRAQGWTVPETQANFVWLRLGEQTAAFAGACEQAGVVVRPFPGEGVRVTIGENEANDIFLKAADGFRKDAQLP